MNERIRELCKRAGFIGEGFQNTVIGTCQETALENLAELIVRECARIARNTDLEDVEGGDSAVLCAAGEQIQKHFGVEE